MAKDKNFRPQLEPPVQSAGRSDARNWLVSAKEPLAGLHLRSGGEIPGPIVTPALLEMVRKARAYGLKLGRAIRAQDENELVTAWLEVEPDTDGEGCEIRQGNWQASASDIGAEADTARRQGIIIRQIAELTAVLGPGQDILAVECEADELAPLAAAMRGGLGRPWTEFVHGTGGRPLQPMHWRLLDGTRAEIEGSDRQWTAHIIPLGKPALSSSGFELYLVADRPLHEQAHARATGTSTGTSTGTVTGTNSRASGTAPALGREIAPVLRQPISRIIANAETIRSQMAGPLAEEYSNYAADIAKAGEHLLALIDDLTVLEMIEDEDFSPAPDQIDLADLAIRAKGILNMRARERGIEVDVPKDGETAPAIGEFRRVLQILLNLLGNAIRYAPEGSQIWLRVEVDAGRARVTVADQGEGLSEEQQARIWHKFERLGRQSDGGSGLGLYISRRLAEAMNGTLTVESAPGHGARFMLELPADQENCAEGA